MVQQKNDQQGTFYKLAAFKKLGAINNTLHYVMDLELWFRYLVANGQDKFVLIDDLLAHFRIHVDSKTAQYEARFREEEKMLWGYMFTRLNAWKELLYWCKTSRNYQPVKWDFERVNSVMLQDKFLQHHFYEFFRAANKPLSRMAFKKLSKAGNMKLSFHALAIFIKLFVGNIPFRKYLQKRA